MIPTPAKKSSEPVNITPITLNQPKRSNSISPKDEKTPKNEQTTKDVQRITNPVFNSSQITKDHEFQKRLVVRKATSEGEGVNSANYEANKGGQNSTSKLQPLPNSVQSSPLQKATSESSVSSIHSESEHLILKGRSHSFTASRINSKQNPIPNVVQTFKRPVRPLKDVEQLEKSVHQNLDDFLPEMEKIFTLIKDFKGSVSQKEQMIKSLEELSLLTLNALKTLRGDVREDFTPLNRPGSIGLTIVDVEKRLYKERTHASYEHAELSSFINKSLLELKDTLIPDRKMCAKTSSKNAKIFLEWVDEHRISELPILNLYLYQQALMDLVKLFEAVQEQIRRDSDVVKKLFCGRQAQPDFMKSLNIPAKVISQFFKFNEKFYSLVVEPNSNSNEIEIPYYSERIQQVISIYKAYITNIEKLLGAMLSKDKKFELYQLEERKEKTREGKIKDGNLVSDQKMLTDLPKEGHLVFGRHIHESKQAGKSSEWSYAVGEAALEIFQGKNKSCALHANSGSQELQDVQKTFSNIIDVFSSQLKLKNLDGIEMLKKYFILQQPIEKGFDLKNFLISIGFEHFISLHDQHLQLLQEKLIQSRGDWGKLKGVGKGNLKWEKFLDCMSGASQNPLNSIASNGLDPLEIICSGFQNLCQLFYFIEADKKNTHREDFAKLLMMIKFVHQDNAYTYIPKTLNAIQVRTTEKQLFRSLVSRTKRSNIPPGTNVNEWNKKIKETEKPTKKYQFFFEEGHFIFKGKSRYEVIGSDEANAYSARETFIVKVPLDEILNPQKWNEYYFVKMTFNKFPPPELQKQFDVFQIHLFRNQIPFKIKYSEKNMNQN